MLKINDFNKIIAANWKMNGSLDFIDNYLANLNSIEIPNDICGIFCPPSIYLNNCKLSNKSLYLGAQDCSIYDNGAYTGDISALMLKDISCDFCIVGHSERRTIFNQSDKDIRLKSSKLIENSIIPILCVGETLDEKNQGLTKQTLRNQISFSMPINASTNTVIIAYEPIWAIGTGLTPSLEEIQEIHYFLKHEIKEFMNYKILYGGSVKSSNSFEILNLQSVDGVLVGGASLDFIEFSKILKN